MSTIRLIRWSGLASLVAGILYAMGAILHPVGETMDAIMSSNWVPSHLVYWISVVLLHFSLIGMYTLLAKDSGWLGLLSFILAFIGTSMVSSILLFVSTVLPLITVEAPEIFEQAHTIPDFLVPVFLVGFGFGWMLTGGLVMRSAILPRWSGLLLVSGVALFVVSEAGLFDMSLSHVLVTLGDIVFGLGLIWIGSSLLFKKHEPASVKSAAGLS
ncbi:MAG: DUF4386 domain-containing protein [Anaerolineae bacterium]|nr:DUF4386 domain-containing protein [Anaerolineae bacterium]